MGFLNNKITGDGTTQTAITNDATLEAVVNSLVAYNTTGGVLSFTISINGSTIFSESVNANGTYRLPDKINLGAVSTLEVNAPIGLDVTVSYLQQAIDVAGALSTVQLLAQQTSDDADRAANIVGQLPAGTIDDLSTSINTVWSSSKVSAELSNLDVSPLNKPVITSPTNGTVDYIGSITSTYSTSDYYEGLQTKVIWECALDATFNDIIDRYEGSDNLTSWTPTIGLPLTQVFIRTMQISDGHRSKFNDTVSFTTPDIFIHTPTITVEGAPSDVKKNPKITLGAFSVFNGTDTHELSDYQVVRVSDGEIVWESLNNTTDLLSITTGDLEVSTEYKFRARQKGQIYGYSNWVETTAITKAVFSVAYGVEWNPTTDTYVRTGVASGVALSTSYAGAIQIQMRRCVLNANGTVKYYLHPTDSTKKADGTPATIDGSDGNVMVEVPKFWSKYEHDSGVHKWSISPEFESGYEVDPAFIRGGVEKDYRYYPAYEGYNLNGKLISGSGRTPTVNQTRAQFRALAAANGAGWSQIDWNLLTAVQLLYLTEYADFDSQAMIGRGNDTGSDYTMTTGGSNSIGNASSPSTNNDTWMSYRGIENWYASMRKFIDGVNVQERKYFINNNPATFADDVFTGDYVDSGITSVATNGYVSNLVPSKKGFVASAVAGSDSTYVPDQFYQGAGNMVVLFGGIAGNGLHCGAFCLAADAAASSSHAGIGSGVSF